jgi:hypothetical protein
VAEDLQIMYTRHLSIIGNTPFKGRVLFNIALAENNRNLAEQKSGF